MVVNQPCRSVVETLHEKLEFSECVEKICHCREIWECPNVICAKGFSPLMLLKGSEKTNTCFCKHLSTDSKQKTVCWSTALKSAHTKLRSLLWIWGLQRGIHHKLWIFLALIWPSRFEIKMNQPQTELTPIMPSEIRCSVTANYDWGTAKDVDKLMNALYHCQPYHIT